MRRVLGVVLTVALAVGAIATSPAAAGAAVAGEPSAPVAATQATPTRSHSLRAVSRKQAAKRHAAKVAARKRAARLAAKKRAARIAAARKAALLKAQAKREQASRSRVEPDATSTGVPAGYVLNVHQGDLTITKPGTVIDGLDIRGSVKVKAANVTIRRSIIRGPAAPPSASMGLLAIVDHAAGFVVEDVSLQPRISHYNVDGIKVNQPGVFRRINVSGTVDGIVIYGSGVQVRDSYLHDFKHFAADPNHGGGPSHDDAIQVQAGRNVTISNNSLSGAFNAAIMITQDAGVTRDLAISSNWIDGGGCSVNFGSKGAYKTGMQASNNVFGRRQRIPGCAIIHNPAVSDLNPIGNVWADSGLAATVKRGA